MPTDRIPAGTATPLLADFLAAYRADDNLWWSISCGHHQNLFDAACDRIDALQGELDELRDRTAQLRAAEHRRKMDAVYLVPTVWNPES